MVINLLILLADRDLSVDQFLVNLVCLGKREHGDEAEDEKRESVEPGSDVSHHPEEDSEFDGVNHVFDKDETTKFSDVGRHVGRDDFSVFLGLFRTDAQVHLQILSEWVSLIALLD